MDEFTELYLRLWGFDYLVIRFKNILYYDIYIFNLLLGENGIISYKYYFEK